MPKNRIPPQKAGQGLRCIGCGAFLAVGRLAFGLTFDGETLPDVACPRCAIRALQDNPYRVTVERSAALGVPVGAIDRAFAVLGVPNPPATAQECAHLAGMTVPELREALRSALQRSRVH